MLSIGHFQSCDQQMKCLNTDQTWVIYVIVLDSNTFLHFAEVVWCVGTHEILSNNQYSAWLGQRHQARSGENWGQTPPMQVCCAVMLKGNSLCDCVLLGNQMCECECECVCMCVCVCVYSTTPWGTVGFFLEMEFRSLTP